LTGHNITPYLRFWLSSALAMRFTKKVAPTAIALLTRQKTVNARVVNGIIV